MKLLTVGSASARPGETVSGFITVPDGGDPGTRIPVSVVTGASDGPVLALIAGIHGSEPSPIVALQRVRAQVRPAELNGTVILVHIANMPSFTHRTIYRGPYDWKNLNRVFPGKHDGTGSERIAHAITTQVIDQCDFLIDMHSGDGNEALRPYSYWMPLGMDDRVDTVTREMALAFGLDHIVVDRTRSAETALTQFCSVTALARGKPAITTEAGSVGIPTELSIAHNVRGAFRVMRYLEMLPGGAELIANPKWIAPSQVLTSPDTGTWHPEVEPGQQITEGALIGRLADYFGETITEITSPLTGVVLYVVASPAMAKGEPMVMVGTVSSTLP
jgi:predicted deacylase